MKKNDNKMKYPIFNIVALVLPVIAFVVGFLWYKAIDRPGMEGMYSVLVVFISVRSRNSRFVYMRNHLALS
jgi:hypothetical protein